MEKPHTISKTSENRTIKTRRYIAIVSVIVSFALLIIQVSPTSESKLSCPFAAQLFSR